MFLITLLIIGSLFCTNACSGKSKRARTTEVRSIAQLIPYGVHYRRTPTKGADPYAGPGGTDYYSEHPPSERFDCEPIASLFREINLAELRECLAGISEKSQILLRLIRDPAPSFSLDPNDKTPECLKRVLPSVPVPREVFFETLEESKPVCYGSRLNIEEDELFWVKMPLAKKALRIELPLRAVPQTDEETVLLLFSWAMTPFWTGAPRGIPSVYVPEALCDACLGRQNRVKRSAPPPGLWP